MASAKSTSIPSKASGRCCAPGSARTAVSRRRSCPSIWASFSSSTTPAGAAKPCSAPSLPPWSHDQTATTPKPRKSLKRFTRSCQAWRRVAGVRHRAIRSRTTSRSMAASSNRGSPRRDPSLRRFHLRHASLSAHGRPPHSRKIVQSTSGSFVPRTSANCFMTSECSARCRLRVGSTAVCVSAWGHGPETARPGYDRACRARHPNGTQARAAQPAP